MKKEQSHASSVGRRGELMAELFLQDLEPTLLARPSHDFGYDFLVVFPNGKGGINTFGVEVKTTERLAEPEFLIDRRTYDLLAHSTPPGFLLVADVKQNRLFFAWPPSVDAQKGEPKRITVPLIQIDNKTRDELRKKLVA